MTTFFMIALFGIVVLVAAMVVFMLKGKLVYDIFNAVLVMNTLIVMVLLIIGFIDGREDMYIDIALSYSILGFITTLILAKYIGGRK